MIVWWSRFVRARQLETGTFDCPHCRSNQKCALVQVARVLRLYSVIPLGAGEELTRYVECLACHSQFDDAQFSVPAGGGRFTPETWPCPKCHAPNLNTRFNCRRCGFAVV